MNTGRLLLFFMPLALLVAAMLYVSGAGTRFSGATAVGLLSLLGGGLLFVSLPGAFLLRAFAVLTVLVAGMVEYYGRVTGFMLVPSLRPRSADLEPTSPERRAAVVQPAGLYLALRADPDRLVCLFPGEFHLAPPAHLCLHLLHPDLHKPTSGPADHPQRSDAHVQWLEKGLAILPLLELPITLHQRFVIARGTTSWDTVAGTFGGYYGGVGRNSDMMLFIIASFAMALHLYQSNRISGSLFWTVFAAVFIITGLGETKAFFVYLPLLLVMQQWPRIKREPHKAILFATVLLAAISLLWSVYAAFNYGARYASQADISALEMADRTLETFLDTNNIDYQAGELGRVATLHIWFTHVKQDVLGAWVGYGLGASRLSSFGVGAIALAYAPLKLTSTAAAQLLWDVGIIGFSLFLATMLAALQFALQQSKRTMNALFASRYRTIAGIILILILSLVYKASMTESVTVKLLFMMLMAALWITRSQDLRDRRPLEEDRP